jgi:outer membrane receptor protein involved in Fe transport
MKNTIFLLILLVAMFLDATAQELETTNLDSLMNAGAFTAESELQKALNKNIAVSALKLSSRETPGIISVITGEEISNSGARDLTDVLRLVPGFDIMQDLQFIQGLSLRGNWSNEGKILVMMDGIPLNDLLYQSVAVGNRFPVDAIERIEIIRGPGSAVYGGSAEYGVINIITKAAESLHGVQVYGTAGFNSDATARTNGGLMAAQRSEDISWDFSVFGGHSIVSNQSYHDYFGAEPAQDLSSKSFADPLNINLGIRYKKFSLRSMYDFFNTGEPFSRVSFETYAIDGRYEVVVNDKLTITPRLQYLSQLPWSANFLDEPGVDFKVRAERTLGQVDANYHMGRRVNVSFGALYFHDVGTDELEGKKVLTLDNFAFYTQALFKHRLANATVGFRFEKNNRYDGAFVPRVGFTKKIENFHFKLLYSRSFRSPSIQNVLLDTTGAVPETSNVFELELGYQFTPEMLLAVNSFYITTQNIIIYGASDGGNEEWYENYEKSGSQGIEVVYSIKKQRWYSQLTYSYSRAIADFTVPIYEVPQTSKQYVGLPLHKITFNTNFNIHPTLSVNPTLIYAGKRYAYVRYDEGPIAAKLDPYILCNIFINYKPTFLPELVAGFGVYDLFNERPVIPQAYEGGEAAYSPIPGRSREFVVKLSYQINFKK